ncbi:hypothetical protein AB0A81_32135 [Streptomyces flaveolus]|uniref:Uncharacterized protein n=1 Tax=Streptomyces flaveolus TaxID=67297 RepID=A0ABV1VJ89_9ACTN
MDAPIVGLLFVGNFPRSALDAARWAYAVFAVAVARLLAHCLTGKLSSSLLDPGLPAAGVVGPFIAGERYRRAQEDFR